MKTKVVLILLFLILCIGSCAKKEMQNFSISGTVKGLKKGTLYLQKIDDTLLVNIDSLVVDGNPDFEFNATLSEPEVLYLYLDKVDNSEYDDRIFFFAEPEAVMTLSTTLENFESFAAITGSQNQSKWGEFEKINKRFNNTNLDLIKSSFEAQNNNNETLIEAYDDSLQRLIQRKYRYTGQFIISHADMAVAPYVAITQIPDAKVTFLEDLYGKLSKEIKSSKYGTSLKDLIEQRKAQENIEENN